MTPLIVAWGGGVNSTALLVGLRRRQTRPDLILFADTGGEKPETYAYVETFSAWLARVGFPPVTVVRKRQTGGAGPGAGARTLEQDCLQKTMLPSLAYGYKSCSQKWKREPQDLFANHWAPARACWAAGGRVRKAIGYDAGEERRRLAALNHPDPKYDYWYPLIEWGWWREECLAAIRAEGLPVPPRSACFFCPASTKREVFALAEAHPDLFARCVEMERNAAPNLDTVKGLGRRFAWGELVAKDRVSLPLFRDLDSPGVDVPCDCFDGEE